MFWLAIAQSIYFTITGIWAIVNMRSFVAITGPKTDIWLVRTVGLLVIAIGVPIGLAALHDRITPEIVLLGAASAVFLAAVDIYYVMRKVIAPIYLLDGVVEIVILVMWIVLWVMGR